jgi:hypothetical protein
MKIIRNLTIVCASKEDFMNAKDQYMAFVSNKTVLTEIGTKKMIVYLT